ncbi:hypothetical protein GCM10025768_03020 [Microbacterium pseudoresistens]
MPALLLSALALPVALTACSSTAAPSVSCDDVLAQASYETMAQLAAAGLAADPDALRDALPDDADAVKNGDGATIELPSYDDARERFSDAEYAQVRSALSSASTGVGAVFDAEALYRALDASGPCAGQLDG